MVAGIQTVLLILLSAVILMNTIPSPESTGKFQFGSGPNPIQDKTDLNLNTLQLVQIIHRHGDRNAVSPTYPTDPYKNVPIGPKGFGQLTKIGKLQGYNLGKYFRSRYDGFLNSSYSSEEIQVVSSDVDRTILTAQCMLAGLFPPSQADPNSNWNPELTQWQPIPVHTISKRIDNKIMQMNCSKYMDLIIKLAASSESIQFDSKYKEFYEFFSNHAQADVTKTDLISKTMLQEIYDNMNVQQKHGYPLPEWTKEFPDFWKTFTTIRDYNFAQKYSTFETALLMGGPLFTKIMGQMIEKQTSPANLPKTLVYSGHDSTIIPVLSILGVLTDDFELPYYACALIFELHRNPETSKYFVEIFYRNHEDQPALQLQIPGCENLCSLEEFSKIKSDYQINDEDWSKKCV